MISGTRCAECEKITIEGLLDIATSRRLGGLPSFDEPEMYYKHHKSLANLEHAADEGCEFCRLVIECFRGCVVTREDGHDPEWECSFHVHWSGNLKPGLSLLTAVKRLESSAVSIFVVFDYFNRRAFDPSPWDLERLAENDVLRYLSVQIDFQDPEEECAIQRLTLRLNITTPRSSPAKIGGFRIGAYQISTNLDSDDLFGTAKDWIEACDRTHTECLSHVIHRLPTRVIDVGMSETWADVRLIHSHGIRRPYLTLSHCWGGPISPKLTQRTIETFQVRLPFSELPTNFQDAIRITRKLGFQYLWIDALCIIQGSSVDSAEKLKGMGDVYRNSSLNISASVSPKSTSGILQLPTTAHAVQPRTATLRVKSGEDISVTVECRDGEHETLSMIYQNGPLSSRGWCLQESILSPRQLLYGMQQFYWRCPSGFQVADGIVSSCDVNTVLLSEISKYLQQDAVEHSEITTSKWHLILRQCYTLVEMYWKRSLTLEDDMLPAFSGMSSRLSPHFGDYLVGLWEKDFRTGLLWSNIAQRRTDRFRRSVTYRAPSWSWATVHGSIQFTMLLPDAFASHSVQLVGKHIVLRDETNPYGEVSYASITLRGLTTPVVHTHMVSIGPTENDGSDVTVNIFALDSGNFHIWSSCLDPIDNSPLPPNTRLDEACPGSGMTDGTPAYLALLVWVADSGTALENTDADPFYGLILKRTRSLAADEHHRFGMFSTEELRKSQVDTWEVKTVRLV